MGAIKVNNIGKAYKQYPSHWSRLMEWIMPFFSPRHQLKWVLRDITFHIQPGESVGIIGVNGAGKSTLLKLITGTTQPTTGSIEISGRVAALLELGMGFHPDFTGRQNVYMAGQLLGLHTDRISELMPDIEAFAEIGSYMNQPVRIYSSGMMVRLAFSVATCVQPDILIVDEALSVGDMHFQAKCYQRLAKFREQGTTLLLVSHSVEDIVKHCDRAILLKNGCIAHEGQSRVVTNCYLDELFGKRKEYHSSSSSSSSSSYDKKIINDILSGIEDKFHSRPGYHKEEHRWGHGGAVILDYLIESDGEQYPSRIMGNAIVNFYFKVRFDTDFDYVVPGFLIKTIEGIFLYGTNSFISTRGKVKVRVFAGDVKVFRFSLSLALNDGDYLISFGISSGNPLQELIPLERRYDSVLLHVDHALSFWGIVDMNASFQLVDDKTVVN